MEITENELIEMAKNSIESTIKHQLSKIENLFLTKGLSPFTEYMVDFDSEGFDWNGDVQIEDITEGRYYKELRERFIASGKLTFRDKNSKQTEEMGHTFNLLGTVTLTRDKKAYSFRIEDNNQELIRKYHGAVEEVRDDIGIPGLFGDGKKFDNVPAHLFLSNVNRKNPPNYIVKKDFELMDDIALLVEDVRFEIAKLKLYRTYLTNYLANPVHTGTRVVYTFFPNFYDKQYLSTAGILSSLMYSYWDKLGDLLELVFPLPPPRRGTKKVYFANVIDKVDFQYHNSANYLWLRDFRSNEYTALNDKRKRVIHYKNIETDFMSNYQNNYSKRAELEALQKEKESLVEYFIEHYNLMIEGFEKTVRLIDEAT